MNEDRSVKLYKFLDAVKGNFSSNDYIYVLAILKKTMDMAECLCDENLNSKEASEDELYNFMIDSANYFEIGNPFSSKEFFLDIYKTIKAIGDIEWTDVFGYDKLNHNIKVPSILSDLMEENFIDGFQEVLIPDADIFSNSIEKIVNTHNDSHFTLTTNNNLYFKLFSAMFELNDMVDVVRTNVYTYGFSDEHFDLILSVPPFGIRDKANEGSPFICREYEMIALENLSLHLNNEGILSIVLPAKITFGGGKVKELRDFIQSMYCLKEIDELPSGIFNNTGIKTYLLTITTGRTEEVIIKRYVPKKTNFKATEINKLIVKDDTFVLDDELTEMGDWNIDRILESQDDDWMAFQESNVKKEELGNVASIFRGKSVNRKDENGNIGVVNISNIGEYDINYSSLDHLEEEERKVTNYLLKEGDLLIPARGTAIRTAIFNEQSYPCIASSNVIVIRASDDSLSTTYLKLFLDSPLGRKMLIARQQGTTVMNISYKELNNMVIPFPSQEEQEQITKKYNEELKIYKKSIIDAENRWKSVLFELREKI